ncbi:flavin reductase family protein [Streptomyces sp. NBC_00237]|nr:flavin reductase family protein [Streptomyces sp. NBC_00237]
MTGPPPLRGVVAGPGTGLPPDYRRLPPDEASDGSVDSARFRAVLGRFASGITVVAALDESDEPDGLARQSFASLSLDPPLVLLGVGRNSSSRSTIERAGRFGASILADDRADICAALGRTGADKFTTFTSADRARAPAAPSPSTTLWPRSIASCTPSTRQVIIT